MEILPGSVLITFGLPIKGLVQASLSRVKQVTTSRKFVSWALDVVLA